MCWANSGLFAGPVGWQRLGLSLTGLETLLLLLLLLLMPLHLSKKRISLALRHAAKLHRWGEESAGIQMDILPKCYLCQYVLYPRENTPYLVSMITAFWLFYVCCRLVGRSDVPCHFTPLAVGMWARMKFCFKWSFVFLSSVYFLVIY